MQIARLAALTVLASSSLFAQSGFNGTWALNQDKSNITGETMKIEDGGSGAIKFVDPNFSYTVKTDGTKAQTPSGATEAIQKKDNDNYHQTYWRSGKELFQADWTLSDGGKTLVVHEYGTKPNGDKLDDTTTYGRTSGDSGLVGEWRTTSVKIGSPNTMTMKAGPGDEMMWDISAEKATWKGKLDGKDYPAKGPTVPKELTLAVTKQGDRALSMTEKLKDKVVFTGTYTLSEDGKTMTMDGKNAKGEPTQEVWEKQGG